MSRPKIAVCLHLFALNLLPEFTEYLSNITKAGYTYDLYVTVPKNKDYRAVRQTWPDATFFERENRGFDIASFFVTLHHILSKPYDYILKLHSKSHETWRHDLIDPILDSPARVRYVLKLFQDPTVGMVGCRKWLLPIGSNWGHNAYHIADISRIWQVPVGPCHFIGGTTFWMRYSILQKLAREVDLLALVAKLNTPDSLDYSWYLMTYPQLRVLKFQDVKDAEKHWQSEGKKQGMACNCLYARIHKIGKPNCDGMIEHAYERFFGLMVEHEQQKVIGLTTQNLLTTSKLQTLVLYHPQQQWSLIQTSSNLLPHNDIGYYQSSDHVVFQKQQQLMKKYGITGVCYYVDSTSLQFLDMVERYAELPFCISWSPREIVDPARLAAIFQHPNYLKQGIKPIVFFPNEVPRHVTSTEFVIIKSVLEVPTHMSQYQGVITEEHFGRDIIKWYNEHMTKEPAENQYLVLKSWNDWKHQKVLEPSQHLGYKYLQELREAQNTFK